MMSRRLSHRLSRRVEPPKRSNPTTLPTGHHHHLINSHDSCCNPCWLQQGSGKEETVPDDVIPRVSHKKLRNLTDNLLPHDRAILQTLVQCRFMSTNQIIRLIFARLEKPDSARRAANRAVARLRDGGLITALERRVGGVRAGSGSCIWSLTPAGARFLNMEDPEGQISRRKYEPSAYFVEHTIAITELYLQLNGIEGIALTESQFEPRCWRNYRAALGYTQTIKPDLYAVTSGSEYEDHWFFELDLASEAPSKVVRKCVQFQEYYLSNAEQRRHGVFPLVVWIVPEERRRASLKDHIARSVELRYKQLFTVILPDELEALIRKGATL